MSGSIGNALGSAVELTVWRRRILGIMMLNLETKRCGMMERCCGSTLYSSKVCAYFGLSVLDCRAVLVVGQHIAAV